MAKVSRGEGKEECCEEEQHVGSALGHQSPCSSCLAPVWTCRSPVSAGNPGMAEPSLGLAFGEGGKELIFSVLPDPFCILKWSRHNCMVSFNFGGKVCQCFCFLIFLALFVNPCQKPLSLSHSNSFKETYLIRCLI